MHSARSFWRKAVTTALSPASIEGCVPRLAGIIQAAVDGWAQRGSASLLHEVGQARRAAMQGRRAAVQRRNAAVHPCRQPL